MNNSDFAIAQRPGRSWCRLWNLGPPPPPPTVGLRASQGSFGVVPSRGSWRGGVARFARSVARAGYVACKCQCLWGSGWQVGLTRCSGLDLLRCGRLTFATSRRNSGSDIWKGWCYCMAAGTIGEPVCSLFLRSPTFCLVLPPSYSSISTFQVVFSFCYADSRMEEGS